MNTKIIAGLLVVAGLPMLSAQTSPNRPNTGAQRDGGGATTNQTGYAYGSPDTFGPRAGDHELTLGGSGQSNRDLDGSSGGLSFQYGYFLNDTLEVGVRQNVNYANPEGAGSNWSGATRAVIDQHIMARGALRPFVGASLGGFYGDDVNETWSLGLETGAKFYVQPKTFILVQVDYSWLLNSSDDVTDNFDDGAFTWSVGVGYNF